jgi:hypothetical protein
MQPILVCLRKKCKNILLSTEPSPCVISRDDSLKIRRLQTGDPRHSTRSHVVNNVQSTVKSLPRQSFRDL